MEELVRLISEEYNISLEQAESKIISFRSLISEGHSLEESITEVYGEDIDKLLKILNPCEVNA